LIVLEKPRLSSRLSAGELRDSAVLPLWQGLLATRRFQGSNHVKLNQSVLKKNLLDDLNNWEKFVDPKEVEELQALEFECHCKE